MATNNPITERECQKVHEALNTRLSSIETKVWWILTFVITTSIALLSNLGLKLVHVTTTYIHNLYASILALLNLA